jgi:hypothetical protein
MTRTGNRNSSIVFFAALILFLIVVVAFAARAQAQAPVLFSPAATYSTGGFDNVFFVMFLWQIGALAITPLGCVRRVAM